MDAKSMYQIVKAHEEKAEKDKEMFQLLLESGTDVNLKDQNGQTALHHAAAEGYDEFVQPLLERGADINEKDNEGKTALHFASAQVHPGVIELLLNRGADINAKDNEGKTARRFALEAAYPLTEGCPSIRHLLDNHLKVMHLLDNHAGIDKSEEKKIPLHLNAAAGQLEIMRLLFNAKNGQALSKEPSEADSAPSSPRPK